MNRIMQKYKFLSISTIFLSIMVLSCTKDLNTSPIDPVVLTTDKVFASDDAYIQLLSKCYGGLVLTGLGTDGGSGSPELANGDEGVTSFLRVLWGAQEMTTDESANTWGDGDLDEYHKQKWSDANSYNFMLYKRIYYNITVCNQYIKTVQPRLNGLNNELKTNVTNYLAEARFLRAMYYYYAMDLWGNVPFVDEKDIIGSFFPKQIKRSDLFNYVESELKAVSHNLLAPSTNAATYGRATKAAAWSVLAKMYLNSEIYLGAGNKKYSECITYCDSITNAGVYTLHSVAKGTKFSPYLELFLGDNGNNCRDEIIFPITCDAIHTQNWGGTTFIIHAAIGGNIPASLMGTGGWGGNVTTSVFSNNFSDLTGKTDTRAMFFAPSLIGNNFLPKTTGFNDSYGITKWRNLNADGTVSSTSDYMNNDFPLIRLADVYLMYAEAVLRGGAGGNTGTSLTYINKIRERAYGNTSGDVASSDINLDFILGERARELYWEASRRTDLIRFGKFSNSTYVWDWKGNVISGAATDSHLDLFPIPASDRSVNTNLVQNPGYGN